MHYLRLVLILVAFALSTNAHASIDPNLPAIAYVNFQTLDPVQPLTVCAQLRIPANTTGKLPAVVIVHGSAGIDSRGKFYAEALNYAGIATLELDMWTPRGLAGGLNRPNHVAKTLPDAYGALKYLSEHPRIDPERIGIMGFSWGGIVSMLTATEPYTTLYTSGALKFAAHLPHYPICYIYNNAAGYDFNSFTGAPVMIQAGELDDYENPDSCPNLVQSLPAAAQAFISVKIYKGATHAWDRLQPEMTVTDPYANEGQGGSVTFTPNPHQASRSRAAAVKFFKRAFCMTGCDR
jgi:dienelactone hydrolase